MRRFGDEKVILAPSAAQVNPDIDGVKHLVTGARLA